MRINRLVIATAGLAAALLAGCGVTPEQSESSVVSYSADYPAYASTEDLVTSADLVVRATTVDTRVEQMRPDAGATGDPQTNPQAGLDAKESGAVPAVVVTVATVRVTEVLKGAVKPGDLVQISQLGGEFKGIRYVESATTFLSTADGNDYVLMLAGHGPDKPYDLLNPTQAMYRVTAGDQLQPVPGGSASSTGIGQLRSLVARAADAAR